MIQCQSRQIINEITALSHNFCIVIAYCATVIYHIVKQAVQFYLVTHQVSEISERVGQSPSHQEIKLSCLSKHIPQIIFIKTLPKHTANKQ